jgi:hypothetical protein
MSIKYRKRKGSKFELDILHFLEDKGLQVVRSAGSYGVADLLCLNFGSIQCKFLRKYPLYNYITDINFPFYLKTDMNNYYLVFDMDNFIIDIESFIKGNPLELYYIKSFKFENLFNKDNIDCLAVKENRKCPIFIYNITNKIDKKEFENMATKTAKKTATKTAKKSAKKTATKKVTAKKTTKKN